MRKLYLSVYVLGILLFALSFFGKTVPVQMTDSNGSEVKVWETGRYKHLHLALDPLIEAVEIVNVINVPDRYGYGGKGDGYEYYRNQTIKRFFFSIPVSIGWFTIALSIFLIWKIWKQTINQSKIRHFIKIGSVFILISVPLLIFDFYKHSTTYNPHIHLEMAAYFIIFAYLFIGLSLLSFSINKNELI
jgi:hypothetical protein